MQSSSSITSNPDGGLGGGGGVFGKFPPAPPQPDDVLNCPGGTVCTAVETLLGPGNGTLTDGW